VNTIATLLENARYTGSAKVIVTEFSGTVVFVSGSSTFTKSLRGTRSGPHKPDRARMGAEMFYDGGKGHRED
jgi:hypothetical protein